MFDRGRARRVLGRASNVYATDSRRSRASLLSERCHRQKQTMRTAEKTTTWIIGSFSFRAFVIPQPYSS